MHLIRKYNMNVINYKINFVCDKNVFNLRNHNCVTFVIMNEFGELPYENIFSD